MPGILALTPPNSSAQTVATNPLIPAEAGLYVLGGETQAPVQASESTLAKMFKGLATGPATDDAEVARLLQSLLATSEMAKPPKPNPVEKVLGTNVRTLAARASIAYPVLRVAAADPALRAMLIAELVSLSLEDGGGVVLPMGLPTHPLPLKRWQEFKENLAGLSASNLPQVQQWLIHMGLLASSPSVAQPSSVAAPSSSRATGATSIPGLAPGGMV